MNFLPSQHGFPFPNVWPAGMPVLTVPTPFGTIPIGDASGGVCGGMIFAAADYYWAEMQRPAEPSPELFRYFVRRLLDSWRLPFGVVKYFDWQRRDTAATMRLTRQREWPRIQSRLNAGQLVPLGLVKGKGWHPRTLGTHHQVLAYGRDGDSLTVYDPNYPGDDSMTLTMSNDAVIHSCEGPCIRGVFLTEYSAKDPLVGRVEALRGPTVQVVETLRGTVGPRRKASSTRPT